MSKKDLKSDPTELFSGLLFTVPAKMGRSPLESSLFLLGPLVVVPGFKRAIVPGSAFTPFWPVLTAGAMLSRTRDRVRDPFPEFFSSKDRSG